MMRNLVNLSADEAYERMIWCKEAVRQLNERSPRKARYWWEKECVRPRWLQCRPAPREKIHQFAERLEQEVYRWVETAIALYDKEDAAELEKRKEARHLLEWELKRKQSMLELVQLCQSTPASERILRGAIRSGGTKLLPAEDGRRELWISQDYHRNSGYIYLLSRSDGWCKIGCTKRKVRQRIDEITRMWRRSLKRGFSSTLSVTYLTADRYKLEDALKFHFRDCRFKRESERKKGDRMYEKGELFALPPDEVSSFRETVAKIESLLLTVEAGRLGLEIMEIEAALKRADAALR